MERGDPPCNPHHNPVPRPCAQDLLSADGRWGVMQQGRWDAFLDWLSGEGLLTTKVQSRTPQVRGGVQPGLLYC